MHQKRWAPRALGVVASTAALYAHIACSSTASPPGVDAGGPHAREAGSSSQAPDGGARVLDTGGALLAPFTCPIPGIFGEPAPGVALLEQLRVAAGLDALEERRAVEVADGEGSSIRAGIPCSGSSDRAACETAFAQLSSRGESLRPAFGELDHAASPADAAGPPGYYLAFTKGNAVGKVSNRAELRALIPAVDTPAKAHLYANAAGYRVECQRADGWIREEADGWSLVTSRGHEKRCSRTDVMLFLHRDGTTEERDVIENQRDPCP